MQQIPNPGDGFFAPPGGLRYVRTFDELLAMGLAPPRAVEQWMLARRGRFDVRFIGAAELLDVEKPSLASEFRARCWGVTMHTPWHVYTITVPGDLGFWAGLEDACRTIDRTMVEHGQALDVTPPVEPSPSVPNSSDSSGGSAP